MSNFFQAARPAAPRAPIAWRIVPLAAVGVLAPWPWGSVEGPWVALWVTVLGVIVAAAPLDEKPALPWGGLALALGFALVAGAQTYSPALPDLGAFHLEALGLPMLALLSFLAGALYGQDRHAARWLLHILAVTAAGYALYAIADDGAWKLVTSASSANLHTPFINRNHAAAFYGSGALIAMSLLLVRAERFLNGPADLVAAAGRPSAKALLSAFAFVMCFTATFVTQSRAGILFTMVALLTQCGLWLTRRLGRSARLWPALGGAAVLGLLAAELAGGRLASRLGAEGLVDASRTEALRSTLAIVRDHPLLGAGLGAFPEVFPAYRGPALNTLEVWDHAHNSWLELASEMGVPFTAAVIGYGLVLSVRFLRRLVAPGRSLEAAPLAGVGVLTLATLHSMVDFPLQIPAYLMLFGVVAGVAWARTEPPRAKLAVRAADIGPVRTE